MLKILGPLMKNPNMPNDDQLPIHTGITCSLKNPAIRCDEKKEFKIEGINKITYRTRSNRDMQSNKDCSLIESAPFHEIKEIQGAD